MSDAVQTRHQVRQALDALEERLEPLIAARLVGVLNGLEWTAILRMLDESRGRARGLYSRNDISSQLRILTERLGDLGYPFDGDPRHPRRVSALGTQLRQLRNTERHNDVLEPHDAWRAGDHAAQLLEALGDREGAGILAAIRDKVGHVLYAAGQPVAAPLEMSAEVEADLDVVPEVSIPDIPAVIQNAPIGNGRLAFEPWRLVALGDASNLENLRQHAAKERVQSALKIIVETEGPVSKDRLSRLVAAAFGRRMTERVRARLLHQIKQFPGTIDNDGFVWPPDIDPAEWREFRPGARARAEDLSPREVANAMRYWADRLGASLAAPEVQAATLATFGRKRRTPGIRAVMDRALPLAE